MARHNLLKKVAPVVMSAAVAFSSMPATAFASDFADSTAEATEVTEDTAEGEIEAVEDVADEDELDIAEDTEDTATEETGTADPFAEEDAFSAGEGEEFTDDAGDELTGEYQYVYAGLSWAQYWSAEGVYKAGNTESSDVLDDHNEYDKGGFDTVTRATANHGLHRGSFQMEAAIIDTEGNEYDVWYWTASNAAVLTDGSKITFNRGAITKEDGSTATMDHYVVKGIKYVPVRVATADFNDFASKYPVVKNGETLAGGFTEMNLQAYTETANVTANTNGLKIATKNSDGSYSFSARQTGTDSGIEEQALKVVEGATPTVKEASGSYGEFLRVDIVDNYGGLGAAMQAVKWDYYGKDSDTVLASYGTKFAADNWMHKSMGIQLGLTDSVRCQLPAGTDGTGRWVLTVYALGYQDYTFEINATNANIVGSTDPSTLDLTGLKAALEKVAALNEEDYTLKSWSAVDLEAEETKEMLDTVNAAIEAGKLTSLTQAAIDEQVNEHLMGAINGLEKLYVSFAKTSGSLYVGGTTKLTVNTNITKPVVTWTSSNEKVATVSGGTVTAKAAGTAKITATVGERTATYTVTVKAPSITATVGKVYVGKTAKVQVKKYGTTAGVSFKSSNTKIAIVSKSGVVTGKKAGTVKITVTAGKLTKTVTVKVAKPSFTLAKSSASIKKGKKVTIKVKATPSSKVTYKSSNKSVATVSSKGVVTGKKKGTAKITVKCNGITRTFKVTVK